MEAASLLRASHLCQIQAEEMWEAALRKIGLIMKVLYLTCQMKYLSWWCEASLLLSTTQINTSRASPLMAASTRLPQRRLWCQTGIKQSQPSGGIRRSSATTAQAIRTRRPLRILCILRAFNRASASNPSLVAPWGTRLGPADLVLKREVSRSCTPAPQALLKFSLE